jgi:pimeloyl-ACP methyl ester carboxylesterase
VTKSVVGRIARALLLVIAASLLIAAATLAVFQWQADQREQYSAASIAPRSGRYVNAADVRVFIQESGPATGPVVLLIHGTGAWSETWRPSMDVLAATGYRAIALDLPPFGYSERPLQPRYSKAAQARRIIGVLDALDVPRAMLVGHSFGGGPTVEAALVAPARVKALVLVDAALSIAEEDSASPEPPTPLLRGLLAIQPLRDGVVATFLTNPQFTRRLLQAFIADPVHATDERVRIYQQPLTVRGSTAAIGQWLPELLAPQASAQSERSSAYRTLAMPLVAIWGDLDTITPLAQGKRLVSLVPQAKLEVIPMVGHIPQIESPAAFNRLLVETLQLLDKFDK